MLLSYLSVYDATMVGVAACVLSYLEDENHYLFS